MDLSNIWANLSDSLIFVFYGEQVYNCLLTALNYLFLAVFFYFLNKVLIAMEKKINKTLLETKIHEYEMLNNTLNKVIENGGDKVVVEEINKAINDTLNDISVLSNMGDGNASCVCYSFYDELAKVKAKDGQEGESTSKASSLEEAKEYDSNETVTYSNRFLVKFGGALDINEVFVNSIKFAPSGDKELIITVRDHLAKDRSGMRYPIISKIMYKCGNMLSEAPFMMSIDYLDEIGNIIYTERYHKCRIIDVMKSDVSYEVDSPNTISFTVSYDEVTYEASH